MGRRRAALRDGRKEGRVGGMRRSRAGWRDWKEGGQVDWRKKTDF